MKGRCLGSPSVMGIRPFRFPGVPTVQMMLEGDLEAGDNIQWRKQDRVLRDSISEAQTGGARGLIERSVVLPGLGKCAGREGPERFVYAQVQ